MVVKRIARLLGMSGVKASAPEMRIYYAHPSHDPKNQKPQSQPQSENRAVYIPPVAPLPVRRSSFTSPRFSKTRVKVLESLFDDKERLKQLTLACIERRGRDGENITVINKEVATAISGSSEYIEDLLARKWIRERLADTRKSLKNEGRIGYNHQTEVWYSKGVATHDLTAKEERFLAAHGLGEGWRRIANEIDAIRWLHQNFTDDEFENFCISIMKTHCKIPLTVTEKRRISGADGGFDGKGVYTIDGKPENVALEAKHYGLHRQVGEDKCDRFVGALIKNGWRHGLFVTTGTFSARFIESVKTFESRNILIELIDQNRLAQIMLTKTTEPHGFGLHRTDIGLTYINENILRQAAL